MPTVQRRARAARGLVAAALAAVVTLALPGPPARADGATDGTVGPVGGPRLGGRGIAVSPEAGVPHLPRLSATSWVLADADTGDVLAAQAPHLRLRPASTLKLLTALTLLDGLDPATAYRARYEDAVVDGSKVGMVPGGTYTVRNLFEGMFLISGNDAATALARVAGGVPQTVTAMNETAQRLQAHDTTAVNPTGLDADGQLTSSYDLALFARAGLQRADFRHYASMVRSVFPGTMVARGPRPSFQIWSQNKLLYRYPGAIGVKTGFTTLARGTFVGAASRGGRTLIAVVMRTGVRAWSEAAALLDWGFANADRLRPVGDLVDPVDPPGPNGGQDGATAEDPGSRGPTQTAVAGLGVGRSGGGPGWLAAVVAAVAGLGVAVAALRTRVLLRRRRRRAAPG